MNFLIQAFGYIGGALISFIGRKAAITSASFATFAALTAGFYTCIYGLLVPIFGQIFNTSVVANGANMTPYLFAAIPDNLGSSIAMVAGAWACFKTYDYLMFLTETAAKSS